jgi:hypothetical protein
MRYLALTDCPEGPDGYLNYLEIDEKNITSVKYHGIFKQDSPNFEEKVETLARPLVGGVRILFYYINFNTRRGANMDVRDEMIVKSSERDLLEYIDEKCKRVNEDERYFKHYTTTQFEPSSFVDKLKLYNDVSRDKMGRYGYFSYYVTIDDKDNYKITNLMKRKQL